MSDTPRVDAAAERGSDFGLPNMVWPGIWPLARQLERELARARDRIARLTAGIEEAEDVLRRIDATMTADKLRALLAEGGK